jgi:hypothetical protein
MVFWWMLDNCILEILILFPTSMPCLICSFFN